VIRYLKILSIALLFFSHSSFAQKDSSFLLLKSYQGDIADVALDNLDNLYIISSAGQVKKFNSSGDSLAVYNQVKKYGKLYSIDVSNPLKLLLFYKDFSTLVVLDRNFAPMATINLRKYSILQPAAIGLSYDNNIWLFDEYDNKLKKIDEQGNQLMETADFRTLFDESFSPQKIINDNGLVYLGDSANGVYVFDNYGSFKKKLPVTNWQSIAIRNNNIISTHNELLTIYNTSTFMQAEMKTPFFKPYYRSFTTSDKLITYSADTLHIYQYHF
jgi:hypothetical protein